MKSKKHNRRKSNKRKSNRRKSRKGGEAIGAGTYGCIFKPAIDCKKNIFGRGPTIDNSLFISKLMTKKNVKDEMKIADNMMPIISNIPNNNKYFIPNMDEKFVQCDVGKLKEEDKENVNKKCKNFTENAKNANILDWIEKNKNKLSMIQQKDGGEDLDKILIRLKNEDIAFMTQFSEITTKIIDLTTNGIMKMNEMGLFHQDIKTVNIVYNNQPSPNNLLRLIDWGLALNINKYKTFSDDIHKRIIFSPIYNNPLGNILFHPENITTINTLKKIKKIKSITNLSIARDIVDKSVGEKHGGHILYMINELYTGNPINIWAKHIEKI